MSADLANGEQVFCLVPLIERKDLRDACVKLLNQEWPRSDAARANSLEKSTSARPPMSLVFVEKQTNRLVGHARLCRLLNDPLGCWIESVIVDPQFRSKGIGRQLMKSVEKTAIAHGFAKAYLSTKDKQTFYTKCGYQLCEPVVYIGCSRVPMTKKFINSLTANQDKPKPSHNGSSSCAPAPFKPAPVADSASVPPPPPAPPLPNILKSTPEQSNMPSKSSSSTTFLPSQFMCKLLV